MQHQWDVAFSEQVLVGGAGRWKPPADGALGMSPSVSSWVERGSGMGQGERCSGWGWDGDVWTGSGVEMSSRMGLGWRYLG